MQTDLSGKIALVTGASRGIGKAICAALVNANAFVIGTATSQENAEAITKALDGKGKGLVYNSIDPSGVSQVMSALQSGGYVPNILVNNAGITRDGLFMRMDDNQWQDVISVNLTAVMQITRAVSKAMIKARNGRIINISSVVGSLGNAGQTNYAASKAGLEGFTRSLAREVASRGVTVNAIAPGYIATDMTSKLTEDQANTIMASIPLGCMGSPQDIANAVVYLAGAGGRYVTGHTLHVNGGMLMA